jgi:hypothetical protein
MAKHVCKTRTDRKSENLEEVVAVRSWPTPTSRDWKDTGRLEMLARFAYKGKLACSVAASYTAKMPDELRKRWPTPTVQDAENNGGPSQYQRNSLPLNAEVGGALNPEWVELLMGFPPGWTEL